jgi:hypothetical protein
LQQQFDGAVFTCPDLRVVGPYDRVAQALGFVQVPSPGLKACTTDRQFLQFCQENYRKPIIIAPHTDCLAWSSDGGDPANIEKAYAAAAWLRHHKCPSACLVMDDGRRPSIIFDGLTNCGRRDVAEKLRQMIADPALKWVYAHDAKASSIRIAHNFSGRQEDSGAIALSSYYLSTDTIGTIRSVIRHFNPEGEELPVYFSPEIGESRKAQIRELFLPQAVL